MLNYLYYKLYQATLKGALRDIPQYMAPVFFASLISVNILVIHIFLVKVDVMPYLFKNSKPGGWRWLVVLLMALSMLYFGKDRREAILQKYTGEDHNKRIRGNVIVSFYVTVSFLSIFAVAFFRPGKL